MFRSDNGAGPAANDESCLIGVRRRDLSTRYGRGRLRRFVGLPCPHCDVPMDWPTRDHRVPISRGGPDRAGNIKVICRACNEDKSSLDEEEFCAWRGGLASRLDRLPRRYDRDGRRIRALNKVVPTMKLYPIIHHFRVRLQYCAITKEAMK